MPSHRSASAVLRRTTAPLALAAALALAGCANTGAPGSGAAGAPGSGAAGAPGQLISQAPLDAAVSLPDAGQQLRILYSATDGVTGQGTVPVSGAVFFPKTPQPPGGWPVVAWAHGTTGVGEACAPSANPRSPRDAAYLGAWLREGFVVVATDYQGLGTPGPHPYLHTRSQAYSVLDAVRAALKMPGVANQVILVGQSQGGGAAFGTAGLAAGYAPDVKVLGTVATGTPYLTPAAGEVRSDPDRVSPQIAYGMYAAVTAKLVQPSFDPATVFLPAAMPAFQASGETCVAPLFARLMREGRTERNSYQPGGQQRLFELVAPVTGYATLKLTQPVFMGIGGKDVDVPTAMQQALVRDACKAGSRIQAHVYADMDHSGTVNASLKDSLPFVRNLLAGKPVASTCGQ
ncbi:lipase family protein [uncultured Pseudacidovorax sp.]|uniref:lipase family protein n=1 Tax=uncultured Pseudacidovorax sp. TaxID=679313 RepID=UPI0025F73D8B|nr:lipase family protein [uncultured Pseudacidovorax sp.]